MPFSPNLRRALAAPLLILFALGVLTFIATRVVGGRLDAWDADDLRTRARVHASDIADAVRTAELQQAL